MNSVLLEILFAIFFGIISGKDFVPIQDEYRERLVATTDFQIPFGKKVNSKSVGKFLNDLKLSPFWKVELDDGIFIATARFFETRNGFDRNLLGFLFETLNVSSGPGNITSVVSNGWATWDDSKSIIIQIVFGSPKWKAPSFCTLSGKAIFKVFDDYENTIGDNSYSTVSLVICDSPDIYLCLSESGNDPMRQRTKTLIPKAINEVERVLALPEKYFVSDVYSSFFDQLFERNPRKSLLKRYPGSQGRDSFYGYLAAKQNIDYEGVMLKVSSEKYCGGEGTSEQTRIRKAEYLGKPYFQDDKLFFEIEDNAVFCLPEFNKEFGFFSGKGKFQANCELINCSRLSLISQIEEFTSWEQ